MTVSIRAEAAAVNPAELDEILQRLRSHGSASALRLVEAPQRLGGGFWAEMWILRLREQGPHLPERVVVRLAPDAELASWETAVQRGVAAQGYPTPAILASGTAGTGRFWSVMEHATGQPLLAGLDGISALVRLPRLGAVLPGQLASVMARLHALDPAPIENDLVQTTGRTVGVDGLLDHFSACAQQVDDPVLTRAIDRLAATRPKASHKVLCHGDLHPFNVLRHDGGLTVLDWTAAQIADPAYDVAFTALLLAHPPLAAPRAVQPIVRAAARSLARRFLRSYDYGAPYPVDAAQLEWHSGLHAVRILLDVAAWRAEGSIGDHRGHPWLMMAADVKRLLPAP